MKRQRKADYFAVLHVLKMAGADGFLGDGIFLPSCKDYVVLMFSALPALGEEVF
jgi:hypothetical protein